jgi:hypothetical protein
MRSNLGDGMITWSLGTEIAYHREVSDNYYLAGDRENAPAKVQ